MLSSLLNKRIELEKYTSTITKGIESNSWDFVKRRKASVSSKILNENEGEIESVEVVITFIMRYDKDIDYTYRIKYNGNYYKILTIDEMGRKNGLIIKTKRYINNEYE